MGTKVFPDRLDLTNGASGGLETMFQRTYRLFEHMYALVLHDGTLFSQGCGNALHALSKAAEQRQGVF